MLTSLVDFGGRLHVVVLHLPIGLLAGLALLEVLALARRTPLDSRVRRPLALAAALASLAAAGSGWLRADAAGYSGDTLELHRWLGIATAATATLAGASLILPRAKALFLPTLALALALLAPAGHLGGTLTHGEGFLVAPFLATPITPPDEPSAPPAPPSRYEATIRPILQAYCAGCHNPAKRKGGLDLTTLESLAQGGESGPAAVACDLNSSELLYRMRLPPDKKGRMPPRDKPQPSDADLANLTAWIADGMP